MRKENARRVRRFFGRSACIQPAAFPEHMPYCLMSIRIRRCAPTKKEAHPSGRASFCCICPKRCVEAGYLPQKYTSGTPKNWIAFSLTVFGKIFYAVLFFNLMRPEFGATMTICSIANFCFPFIATHTATPPNLFSAFGEELFWLQVAISLIIPFFCYFGV